MYRFRRIALVCALLAVVCWQAAFAADVDIEGTWSGKAKVSFVSANASITFSGGSFSSTAAGKTVSGTYSISGNTITLSAEGTSGKLKLSHKGDKYTLSGSHSAFGLKGTISVSKTIKTESEEKTENPDDSSSANGDSSLAQGTDASANPAKVLLKKGDKKDSVKELQQRLIELWYMQGEATGYYGELTQSAVSEFQAMAGLDETGKLDQQTSDAMFAEDAPPSDYYNSLNDRIAATNAILTEQGIDAYMESLKSMLAVLKQGEVPDDDDQNMLYSEALDTLVFKNADVNDMIAVVEPLISDREAGIASFRGALVSRGYMGEDSSRIMLSPDMSKPEMMRQIGVTPELFVALTKAAGIEL